MKRTMTLLTIAAFVLTTTTAVQPATQSVRTPVSFVTIGACNGDILHLEGVIHTTIGITANANGFHLEAHSNYAGVRGESLVTGAKYVLNGAANQAVNLSFSSPGTTQAVIESVVLNGQGQVENYRALVRIQFKVNANGEVKVDINEFESVCN